MRGWAALLWLSVVAVCVLILVLVSGVLPGLAESAQALCSRQVLRGDVVRRLLRLLLRGMGAALPERPRFLLWRSDDPGRSALSVQLGARLGSVRTLAPPLFRRACASVSPRARARPPLTGLTRRRYLWMPFFVVGGLLLFMVTTSFFAVNCQSACPQALRPCCIIFSDFLAFIIMAAEILLGVITFAFKGFAKEKMEELTHRVENDADCDKSATGRCHPDAFREMEGMLMFIGIGSFIAAGLQVVRLVAGRGVRKSPRERFPSNIQWEQAYDDMRTNSRRSTPYQRIHGNVGPRDPNAV
eukprot:COSAG02_NODE_6503_length_3534_cov_2.486463_3_plen_300_part_00